jgi:parvulin-like peptidyl-prolyl isomerase
VKRQLSGAVVALAVIASGALASACQVTPTAASAGGATISVDSLNTELHTLETTVAGGCLLQLENAELSTFAGQGAGGSGTYSMTFANAVLNNQVGDLLAQQYAASKGITVAPGDLVSAKSDFESTLDGEISQQVQDAESEGTVSYCELASGSTLTGQQLLSALPSAVSAAQVHNQAVDEKLLARGANLSEAAVKKYYNANIPLFTEACVSRIVTDTDAHANQLVAQIDAGAPFASVAEANSLDTQTKASGGALGCSFTLSQIEQDLNVQSVTVGQPVAPIQDPTSGQWIIYSVTSQQVEPLAQATSVVRRELLQTTANVQRVSKELVAYAHHADVSVNPQYGTWKGLAVVPPVGPPAKFLLPGATTSTLGSGKAVGSGSSGTGSSGTSSSGSSGSGTSTGSTGSTTGTGSGSSGASSSGASGSASGG